MTENKSRQILVTAPFDDQYIEQLRAVGQVTRIEPSMDGGSIAAKGLGNTLANCNVIIAELDVVDQATLDAAPDLELVVSCRAKPVNVDIEACTQRGIPVATTPGRNAEVTADFSFALILATIRKLSQAERWMRAGNWTEDKVFEPYERFRSVGLNGRTIGILGGGAVGARVLRRARGFGMNALVYDPFLPEDHFGSEARVTSLEEVMSTADVITVHVPLMPATEGLVGARELALMRRDAFFVNAGRAAIVDEAALMDVLRDRRIAGAGFDVYYREPLEADSELFKLPNVTVTPHIAGASDDVIIEHSRMATEAVEALAHRSPIRSVINRDDLNLV